MINPKTVYALAGILVVCIMVFAQGKNSETTEIEKAVLARLAEVQKAAEEMDPEKVFSYVLENNRGALITDGRLQLTRQEALESTKRGFQGLQSVEYTFKDQHVTVLSPTTALVVGEGTTSFSTTDGRSFTTQFAQTVVFQLKDGEWKVLHAHRSFPQRR